MNLLLTPLSRALEQLDDKVFLGVILQSLGWAALCFAGLFAVSVGAIDRLAGLAGTWGWVADAVGGIGAMLLALWLFFPVAAAIGTLFIEQVARAVERRFYPDLPPARGAAIAAQAWDGLSVGVRILVFNILALVLALLVPGLGLLLAWGIGAYAIGRGLFVAVAMLRMDRPEAEALYQRRRGVILANGAVLALASYVPLLNLLIPVIGTAVMVHVLDGARQQIPSATKSFR